MKKMSKNNRFVINSMIKDGYNKVIVYYNEKKVYERAKCRLYKNEKLQGIKSGKQLPNIVQLGDKRVLILICYEILFPEDYIKLIKEVDLVIHLVGFPMFDENQKEGWIAMQKALSIFYQCPLVCSCGGQHGEMNITGIIEV